MATLFQLPKTAPVFAGSSLASSKLYFFQSGTLTPIVTYTTAALSVAHAHPVVADGDGIFPPIFLNEAVNATYRMQLKTSADVLKYDVDSLNTDIKAADIGAWAGTASGTDTLTLTPSPAINAYATGQCFRFVSSAANTGAVTVAVSGLAAKAITKNGSTALVAGDIPSGAVVTISYDGTQFQMTDIITTGFGTYTGTLVGCTTSPTVTVKYAVVGKMVTLHVPGVSATSNSTSCTLSGAPASLRPANADTAYMVIPMFYNNGAREDGAVSCAMRTDGVLEFVRAGSITGFTNSGTKGLFSSVQLTYNLNTV